MTLTFTLASINFMFFFALRSAYYFVKPLFKQHYLLPNVFLSCMDFSLFTGIACGYLVKYWLFNNKHSNKNYKISVIILFLFNLFLAITPQFYKVNSSQVKMVLLGSVFCIGLPHSCFQSFFIANLKKSYADENGNLMLIFWSASGHIGKTLGVFLMAYLITSGKMSWEMSLLTLNILILFINCCAYLHFGPNIPETQEPNHFQQGQQQNHQDAIQNSNDINMNDFINFVYVFLENKLAKSYILLASIYKGLAENFLLWLPVYLASYNYQQLIGISSFVFIFPIIIGSFVIGLMYENQADRANRITNSIFFLITSSILAVFGFVGLVHLSLNYLQFIVFITLLGIVINGIYNVLLVSQDFSLTLNQKQKDMMWTLIKASTNIGIGVIDLSTGIYLEIVDLIHGRHQKNQDAIFNLFLVVSLLALFVFVGWYWIAAQRLERLERNERNQLEQANI